jgi:hypothetical protein
MLLSFLCIHTHDLIDSAPFHRKREVIDKLQEHQIEYQYLSLWQDWDLNSEKSFTIHGNLKSPIYATIINWISGICCS